MGTAEIPARTLAAIRARARYLAARLPLPTDEQVRIIGPLLGPRPGSAKPRRRTDAA